MDLIHEKTFALAIKRLSVNLKNALSYGEWSQANAKLASLVLKPRVNLTRYHGVFAPNSKHRVRVTPAKRGRGRAPCVDDLDAVTQTGIHQE